MTQSWLPRMLAAWLPTQRWFAGGAAVTSVEIISDIALADGAVEVRHLIVGVPAGPAAAAAPQAMTATTEYQVLVAVRADFPDALAGAMIGTAPDGRIAYDGAFDPEVTAALLRDLASGRTTGPLRFAVVPGTVIDPAAPGRTLPAATSNTSIVYGDQAILKLLRRPLHGRHPDLEIPAALAASGSDLVAAPLGWIELAGTGGDAAAAAGSGATEGQVLGILSRFFPGATDGWSLAIESLHAEPPDFSRQARELGAATARLHAELAAAFGTSELSGAELAAMADAMTADLAAAVEVVPGLDRCQARVAACYRQLADARQPVVAQRIHGDYHLGQVLGTGGGWVVLDFEGEPSVPIERRRAQAPPLRDVAGMLRSFDYAARHQALRHPSDASLQALAARWVETCQREFCAGYADVSGTDPQGSGPLLRAFTFSKAVYEAVYEVRHRPDWLPIPLGALAEAGP